MEKKVTKAEGSEEKHMVVPSSSSLSPGYEAKSAQKAAASGMPGWVKALGIILILLVVMLVIMHLTGNGFGNHMGMSLIILYRVI